MRKLIILTLIYLLCLFWVNSLAQNLQLKNNIVSSTIFGNNPPFWYSLDLDGSTEYAYINNPTGLDLNSANYVSDSYNQDMTAVFKSNFGETIVGSFSNARTSTTYNVDGIADSSDVARIMASFEYNTHRVYYNSYVDDGIKNISISFDYYIPSTNDTVDVLYFWLYDGTSIRSIKYLTELDTWASFDTSIVISDDVGNIYWQMETDESPNNYLPIDTNYIYLKNIIISQSNYTSNGDAEISFADNKMVTSITGTDLFEQDSNFLYQDNYIDLDGSTEYAYINNPTGLDLNSANYVSESYNQDMTKTFELDNMVGNYGRIGGAISTNYDTVKTVGGGGGILTNTEYLKPNTTYYIKVLGTTVNSDDNFSVRMLGDHGNNVLIAGFGEAVATTNSDTDGKIYLRNGVEETTAITFLEIYELDYTSNGDTEISFADNKMVIGVDKDELITNVADREFSSITGNWFLDEGWAIEGGVLNSAGGANFSQSRIWGLLQGGQTYDITFTLVMTSGLMQIGVNEVYSAVINTSGTHTVRITSDGSGLVPLRISKGSSTSYTLDNISAKLVPQDTDYVSLSQDNLSTQLEHGKNYTVQFDVSSEGLPTGVEKFSNQTFSSDWWWTLYDGWVIADGVATQDSVAGAMTTTMATFVGTKYEFSVDLIDYVSGNLTITIGSYGGVTLTPTGDGRYSIRVEPFGHSTQMLTISSSADFSGSIDNVSLKEITYSDIAVKVGNSADTLITTGIETTYAYTFTYDSTGMTVIDNFDFTDFIWAMNTGNGSILSNNSWEKISGNAGVYTTPPLTVGNKYRVIVEGTKKQSGNFISISDQTWATPRYSANVYDNNFSIDTVFKAHTRTGFLIYCVGSYNDTITITNLHIEELPDIQILPQANDTFYVDNVDISEAYDLEVEGWMYKNDTGNDFIINLEPSSGDAFRMWNSGTSAFVSWGDDDSGDNIALFAWSSGVWKNFIVNIHRMSSSTTWFSGITDSKSTTWEAKRWNKLYIGRWSLNNNYTLNGQIGKTTFTRKNGLGEVVNTTIYDWKGTSDTFLDDKGTNGNDLTGINVTIGDMDEVGYITKGDFESADSTWSWNVYSNNTIEQTTYNGRECLAITFVDSEEGAHTYLTDSYDLTEDLEIGKTYKLTYWAAINSGSAEGRLYDGSGYATNVTINSSDWELKEFNFTANSINPFIRFTDLSAGEIIYIDGISLDSAPNENDYLALSQDNLTYPFEHGKNYTVQFDAYSEGNAVTVIDKEQWSDSSYWTTVGSAAIIYSDSIVFDASGGAQLILQTKSGFFEDGKAYQWYMNVTEDPSSTGSFYSPYDLNGGYNELISSTGEYSGIYIDNNDYDYDGDKLGIFALSGAKFTIDKFWVKEITYSDIAVKVGNGHGADLDTEGSYDSGIGGWGKYGNNTVTNVSGEVEIAYIDNSNGAILYFRDNKNLSTDLIVGDKYLFKIDAYNNGVDKNNLWIYDGVSYSLQTSDAFTATKTTIYHEFTAKSTTDAFCLITGLSSGEKVYVDNTHLYKIGTTHTTTGTETTYAYTFTYDSTGYGTTGNPIQFLPQANDTFYVDNVDVSEAYDLEIEGWFNFRQFTDGGIVLALGSGYNTDITDFFTLESRILSSTIRYRMSDNNLFAKYEAIKSGLSDSTWYKYKCILSPFGVWEFYLNDVLELTSAQLTLTTTKYNSLGVGKAQTSYLNGQIGTTTFTRKNGLGQTVNTSIYDWKGTSDTFLDDKGTNGNDLTGVNVTTDDQTKWTKNYIKEK